MKTYTFRITQDLKAFYEAKIDIKARSLKEANSKVYNMSTKQLDKLAYDWEQNTDNASPEGQIEVHECLTDEDE